MPLLSRKGEIADAWIRLDGGTALPVERDVILPLARLDADGAAVLAAGRRLGVLVPGDAALGALASWLDRLSLTAIGFPSFADGRGFSLARQLRIRGFRGEIRACGTLIADQFAFALGCGFDTIEIDPPLAARQPIADWLAAVQTISLSYQRDYIGPRNILEARRAARAAVQRTRAAQAEPAK
jgi:uncharacterized protein (DUF934 family)